MDKTFPVIIIILFFLASIVSITFGDWKKFLLYLLSGLLNLLFIYM